MSAAATPARKFGGPGTPAVPAPRLHPNARDFFDSAQMRAREACAGDPARDSSSSLVRPISARSGELGAKIGLLVFGMTTVRAVTIICEAQ
jgi:hypothetical protein